MTVTLDVKAKAPYPAGVLSNFVPHVFSFDGIRCASMEGFLQSLKIEDRAEQERVCGLAGPVAQSVGRKYDWSVTGTLWWREKPYDRFSEGYQGLLIGPIRRSLINRKRFETHSPPRAMRVSRIRLANPTPV